MLEDRYEILLNPREDRYFVHDKERGWVAGLSEIVWGYLEAIGADDFPHTAMFGGEDGDVLITDAPTVPFEEQTIPLKDIFDDYFQHKKPNDYQGGQYERTKVPQEACCD